MRSVAAMAAAMMLAAAAAAQHNHHAAGMAMPHAPVSPEATPVSASQPPRAQPVPSPTARPVGDGAAGTRPSEAPAMPTHDHAGMGDAMDHSVHGEVAPTTPASAPPPIPHDHAADAIYGPAAMAPSRALLRHENGAMPASMLLLKQLEVRAGDGRDQYRWEGEAFVGGDINRLAIKSEGEWARGRRLEDAEVQALYSRAIAPYFNLQAGVRHDLRPTPDRTYAVIAIEGLAPYWFDVEGELFLSTRGDMLARAEASYDQRITQRLVLQPQAEFNFAARKDPARRIGAGLTDIDAGLRLRYEFQPGFAPYIGFSWERKIGRTARYAHADGDGAGGARFIGGIRLFF